MCVLARGGTRGGRHTIARSVLPLTRLTLPRDLNGYSSFLTGLYKPCGKRDFLCPERIGS